MKRELGNVSGETLVKNVSDVKTWGEPNNWQLICKAWSEEQGWMRSTKAMEIGDLGCLVQVSTIETNSDGSRSVAEAVIFVPGTTILAKANEEGGIESRTLARRLPDPPATTGGGMMDALLKKSEK